MKMMGIILLTFIFTSCGAPKIIRTKDKCTVEKHVQDDIYQIKINDKPVNNRWYLEKDANEIKLILAINNKCMR
ncbi:hypothetical protein A9Q84_16460 [Halobacteriovorax marinus]|uniref:Lipoprotein n=1 Tax=Halobacteriovorax marinus TaxID=97084 RepID=A0A1Y5F4U8_9BACT|nr:hypothetical protein A9Q84_16460 [Halobacteriovorax marinus]